MSQILVGVDVSLKTHHVHFMNGDGQSLDEFSVPNNREGADTLIQRLLKRAQSGQAADLRIGMEATDQYSWHIAHYLRAQLKGYEPDYQTSVYVLNARKVARFKKGYDTLPKNDHIDAWVIADHLRFDRLPRAMQETVQYEALQRLTRTRFHFMKELARNKTFFLNQLFLKFSGLRQDSPFANTFGATSLAVIEELEPERIAEMSIEDLVDFLQVKGKHHFSEPEEIAQYLKKLARSSYQLTPSMKDPVNLSMSVTLSLIRHIEMQVKRLDKEISRLMQAIPQRLVLTSVKGIGDVFAAGLLAEIGDIKRFKSHHALAKYAGLVWSQYQSGEYESEDTSRIRTGDKYLRYYLIQAADSIRKYDSDYQAFYQKKYREVTRHQHKRALVLTARKLVRLVYSLLSTNQLYTPPEGRT
ncbi:IS110 family transposase [Sporolactobacillus vineae]|jgi:transposase|uniref:IS110 family transposase n=1 Tax=Sporolactobacillus vineae TaxID=444463 RepID=UPI000287B6E6|nr:IS110 family transposase [Sporolactobacillus vineae]